jgi:DNA-binding NtrC family response regulator
VLKRSIFYFDDEATTLNLFREMFGHEYDVRITTRLAEARRMLSEQPTDIIITDQDMPEISGMEFLSEVAKTYPSSYRVMLTGSMLAGEALPEIMSGIVQLFIPKPWNKHIMQRMLERACAQIDLNREKA